MNRGTPLRLAAFAALAVFAAPAFAQMGGACFMKELSKICTDPQGSPEFSACAQQHGRDAMAACQNAGASAAAASAKTSAAAASPCSEDVQKYCPGKWPGTPEFAACMTEHHGDLTPACQAWSKKRAAMPRKAGDDVCVADAKKFCPGLTVADGPKFGACMMKNNDGLSPACQAKLKTSKGAMNAHADCMSDLQKLCPDLQPGDQGGMTQCMMAHPGDMPASCRRKK